MTAFMRGSFTLIFTFILALYSYGEALDKQPPGLDYVLNKGQWHSNVLYKTKFGNTAIFVEKNKLTYLQVNPDDLKLNLEQRKNRSIDKNFKFRSHALQVEFLNGSEDVSIYGENIKKEYHNYYIGDDSGKWATEAPVYQTIRYQGLYEGIDALMYSSESNLKYDFVVAPSGNTNSIKLKYSGADEIRLNNGNLELKTSVGTITELKPYAYQVINGQTMEIPCEYVLNENIVSFHFPNGYNQAYELTIDPVVIAATYSGTTTEVMGYGSTYGTGGTIYNAAGDFWGAGYPITTGAYNTTVNSTTIAITKFSSDGSSIIYSTYIGGSTYETCISLIANSNDELHMLCNVEGSGYPVSANAYSTSPAGGDDLAITIFNPGGTALLGSTYIGGNDEEHFWGEIVLDNQNNCYVAGGSKSSNFPTTTGAFKENKSNYYDAVVFKMNPDLSQLIWSTFIGGNKNDWAIGLDIDAQGDIYAVGNYKSTNNLLSSGFQSSNGGGEDGFIAKLSSDGSQLLASSYVGGNDDDRLDRVEIDSNGDVVVAGVSASTNMPTTPGTMSVGPDDNFIISRFSPDLNTLDYMMLWGRVADGSLIQTGLQIQALKTDACNQVYFSAFMPQTNGGSGWPIHSDFPTTPDAIQTTVGGVYIGIISSDGMNLVSGTYYGDIYSSHISTGHARFDDQMRLYQGFDSFRFDLGGPTVFPTTSNAYSVSTAVPDESSSNSVAVIDMHISLLAGLDGIAQICGTSTFNLLDSLNGTPDTGGSWSPTLSSGTDIFDPSVDQAGTYTYSITDCLGNTSSANVVVSLNSTLNTGTNGTISLCSTDPITDLFLQLGGTPSTGGSWSPTLSSGTGMFDPSVDPSGTYTYTISNICGTSSSNVTVSIVPNLSPGSNGTVSICGTSTIVNLLDSLGGSPDTGGSWSPPLNSGTNTFDPSSDTPGTYTYTINDCSGTPQTAQVVVTVNPMPNSGLNGSIILCSDDPSTDLFQELGGSPDTGGSWSPTLSSGTGVFDPANDLEGTYTYTTSNICGTSSSTVTVTVSPNQSPGTDGTASVCPSIVFNLMDSLTGNPDLGGTWSPSLASGTDLFDASVDAPGTYTYTVNDCEGNPLTAEVLVVIFSTPNLILSPDVTINLGQSTNLSASGSNGSYTWSPANWLDCTNCENPIATPVQTTTYTVNLVDDNGCSINGNVTVTVESENVIFIPNVFSPNDDNQNDVLYVREQGVSELTFMIYNRWGEKIFESQTSNSGWDGTYKGEKMNGGVYVYFVEATFLNGETTSLKGNVTLIR